VEARDSGTSRLLLARIRGLFLCFAILLAALTAPAMLVSPAPIPSRIGVACATVLLVGWWILSWRRGRYLVWLEPLEWVAATGQIVVLGAQNGGIGLFFGALFFRGLYGTWRMVTLRTVFAMVVILVPLLTHSAIPGGRVIDDPGLVGVAAFVPTFIHLLSRLVGQHDRLIHREQVLRAGADAVAGTRDRDHVQEIAVATALALIHQPEDACVTLSVREGTLARIVRAAGVDATELVGQAFLLCAVAPDVAAQLASGEPVLLEGSGVGRAGAGTQFDGQAGSLFIVPMRAGGLGLGALTVSSAHRLPRELQASLATWAVQVASCLESLNLHEELSRRAFHDPLTELPNRALVDRRLTEAITGCPADARVAFLLLDLDRFKPVNDQYGHQAGDELLRQIAGRLRGCVRKADTVGRLGGDEFAVVLPALASPDEAVEVARRLVAAMAVPFAVSPHVVTIGASVGIAFAEGCVGGADPLAIVRAADAAMYRAKSEGSGGWVVYDPAAHAAA
jgi:diguanylate cyclase (GGDEF)-like protein